MKSTRNIVFVVLVLVGSFLLLTLTNPQSTPSYFLILPFVLLFILLFELVKAVLRRNFKSLTGKNNRKRTAIAAVSAVLPVVLLALQSVGQLTARDTITIFLLVIVIGFYISRFSFKKDQQV